MYIIGIKTQFEGFHRYKDAPEQVKFLRQWHRHEFNVEILFETKHNNRDLEFFIIKKKIDKYLNRTFHMRTFEFSCEQIAEQIAKKFNAVEVKVIEDNQNFGIYKLN